MDRDGCFRKSDLDFDLMVFDQKAKLFREVFPEQIWSGDCGLIAPRLTQKANVDCFEVVINEGSYRALAEEVSRVTGNQETVAAVKSAWHVARKKLALALERRGYNLIPVE